MNKALKILGIIFGSIALFLIFIVIVSLSIFSDVSNEASKNSSSSNVSKEKQYDLELISMNCYKEYGYFYITGEVKNISGKSLENVEAVGSAYTEDGTFVKSDSALIEYDPILAGQTSTFEVVTTGNPAISKCKVENKEFWGGSFSMKDGR